MPADAGRGPNSTPSSNEGDQQQLSGTAGPQHHPLVLAFGEEGGGKAVLEVLVRVGVAALTAWPGERTLQACFSALTLFVQTFFFSNLFCHNVGTGNCTMGCLKCV